MAFIIIGSIVLVVLGALAWHARKNHNSTSSQWNID